MVAHLPGRKKKDGVMMIGVDDDVDEMKDEG
jgi:hypothetical protein